MLAALVCLPAEFAFAHGEWSREATVLEYRGGTRTAAILAPDRRKKAIVDGVSLRVEMDGPRLPGIENAGVSTLAELRWAPDSRAFFITESHGGAVGEWRVTVYMIETQSVRSVDVTSEVTREFKQHYRCAEPEEPNVGAVRWVDGSNQLLVVAEVPPHSSCPEMGKVKGYVVKVPTGRIVQAFDARELKTRWGRYLGDRLKRK